jgi:NAD-reducing hydrogenase small subunit
MTKPTLATTWLDGCSGCHMSILDLDERLIALAQRVDVVYGPYVDAKAFPDSVDVTLVEGAVSSEDDLHKIQHIREHTKFLIALGDCAITGNVPAMRNAYMPQTVLARAYEHPPDRCVPRLLPTARPIHELVKVDLFIPGCPPPANAIFYALSELLDGRIPDLREKTRFGA